MLLMRVIELHRVPSLKFVGLRVLKIWLIFGHGISRSGDLTFGLSTSKWGHGSSVSPSCQKSASSTLP